MFKKRYVELMTWYNDDDYAEKRLKAGKKVLVRKNYSGSGFKYLEIDKGYYYTFIGKFLAIIAIKFLNWICRRIKIERFSHCYF